MFGAHTLKMGLFAALAAFAAQAEAQLQSIEEAMAISKKTGRLIFAMAGNAK